MKNIFTTIGRAYVDSIIDGADNIKRAVCRKKTSLEDIANSAIQFGVGFGEIKYSGEIAIGTGLISIASAIVVGK